MTTNTPVALDDDEALAEFAARALQTGEEAQAVPAVRDAATRHNGALLWQWTALLQRSLDEHRDALESFEKAASLAPAAITNVSGTLTKEPE